MAENGPSEKAVEAAAKATAYLSREGVGNPGPDFFSTPYARAALVAAHDPALGLDRSVCLRDVLNEVWNATGYAGLSDSERKRIAQRIEQTFTGPSSPEGETA